MIQQQTCKTSSKLNNIHNSQLQGARHTILREAAAQQQSEATLREGAIHSKHSS